MKPARYIFLNQGLGMSAGKCAAQSAHAEMLAMHDYLENPRDHIHPRDHDIRWMADQNVLFHKWFDGGHYPKYVMKCNDSTQMHTTERYLKDRGFKTYMVIDEGHTEDTWLVPTAMSVELVDKDDERTASIFETFRMYKDKKSNIPIKTKKRWWHWPEWRP